MEFPVEVRIWDRLVGVVDFRHGLGRFQYAPEWVDEGVEMSPLKMPLSNRVYAFPELMRTRSFVGLPGLVADALPEKFGNTLLSQYLAAQGRTFDETSAAERLCYLGSRGMGALEFAPDHGRLDLPEAMKVDVSKLVAVAQQVLSDRTNMVTSMDEAGMEMLVQIGTSAGGAKAKAVIAWHRDTNEVLSGQGKVPPGYEHWLIKFDGIENEELATARNIGRIEYAYYLMAQAAGIDMMESRLFEEDGRAHFMTKRFDRNEAGDRFHVQSFSGLAHADRDPPGQIGYESLFTTMRKLGLNQDAQSQMFRRMVFNILARNQDDHSKNHGFLMGGDGEWRITPGYDICFAYKPGNEFIEQHQMSCNGKRDGFTPKDLHAAARIADIKRPQTIIDEVSETLQRWPEFAQQAGLPEPQMAAIGGLFRELSHQPAAQLGPQPLKLQLDAGKTRQQCKTPAQDVTPSTPGNEFDR